MLKALFYSFPVQLLIHHFKKNQVLLLVWAFLFAVVTQNFGKVLGIPYLFLDPEYMYRVSFQSFFVVGLVLGTFTMAFHITCYILDGAKFPFLGTQVRPFTKFCINNSLIPLAFLITYIICIIQFQLESEYNSLSRISIYIGGLLSGFLLMLNLMFLYFRFTNHDIFRYFASNVDRKLKKIKIARASLVRRLAASKKKPTKISYFLDLRFRPQPVTIDQRVYDKEAILKVFDQNHLNSVTMELIVLALILTLGVFREHAIFQIPAAASSFLLFTIVLMFIGALSFWLRGWTVTVVIVALLTLNYTSRYSIFQNTYQAYGLNYEEPPVEYSLASLQDFNDSTYQAQDKENTLKILHNWRAKFPLAEKPKMVFICTSGGGQRAALWTMRSLQTADSLTGGNLMRNSMLITGASGGMVGAAYYRELVLRKQQGEEINPYAPEYLDRISRDNLNPIIFSLLVNDLFIKYQKFNYKGHSYLKDRGYAFEQQLNLNTEGFMDKPLSYYRLPEQKSLIPMMLVSPSITNDGRKLFISPQNVSYMNTAEGASRETVDDKAKGIDFLRLFKNHNAENLRFLSALRMAATFPYITPNISLPSSPPMETMDSGIADNFGIEDATRFLYVFRDWIAENTSGVVLVCIRDSEKELPIEKNLSPTLFQKLFTPIQNIYKNWTYIQDIKNDNLIEFTKTWFAGDLHRIDLQYVPRTIFKDEEPAQNEAQEQKKLEKEEQERASLNWHLTTREKKNIRDNIYLNINQQELQHLRELLGHGQKIPQLLSKKEEPSEVVSRGQAGGGQ